MDALNPVVFAPLLFLIAFPVFWCGIVWVLAHSGGWARLGQHYATHQTPRGAPFRWQSASVGWVAYNHVLRVDAAHEGLFLSMPWPFRVGHPPLFIPWTAVHDPTEQRMFWLRFVRFTVGSPPLVRMRLRAEVYEASQAGRAALMPKS